MTALPTSGSFAMVDSTHVAAVGPAAAILYSRIVWRSELSGEWQATRRMLLQETGLTEPMLRTAIGVLREREWVATRRTSTDDATLVWKPLHAGQADMAESATPPLRNPLHPPADSAISSLETGKKTTSLTAEGEGLFGDPAPGPLRPAPVDALFDEWYARYPRKVGKGQARKAYAAALRKVSSPQVLLDGLDAALPDLASREPSYRPHPASWLNGERWADEQTPTMAAPSGGVHYDETTPEAQAAYLASLGPKPKRDLYG